MPTTRRQFIKRSAGIVTASVLLPKLLLGGTRGQETPAAANGKILVVIQLAGGNAGLNTVIPYAASNYHRLRPALGFSDTDLVDAQGQSTILGSNLGLHPAMGEMKGFFDQGKLAV